MTRTSAGLLCATVLILLGLAATGVHSQAPRAQFSRELSGYSTEGNAVSAESGNVAVYANNYSSSNKAYLGARCCAGDFYGLVFVHGNLEVSGRKQFAIDSPTDPANKYLYHAAVESSEMKNMYDGVVTLDQKGIAVVELPEWFGALNNDLRYQLTAIGAPAPSLFIAREVADNKFTIAGGTPGLKVSWMVTGVRQDAWALANPMPVERPKPPAERGTYLHPEVFGQSQDRGIERVRQ